MAPYKKSIKEFLMPPNGMAYIRSVAIKFAARIGYRMRSEEKESWIWEEIRKFYNYEVSKFCLFKGEPNLYKQVAFISFWMRKLKPFYPRNESNRYINEIVSLGVALILLRRNITEKKVFAASDFIPLAEEIIYSLRYAASPPHMIALILASLWDNKRSGDNMINN